MTTASPARVRTPDPGTRSPALPLLLAAFAVVVQAAAQVLISRQFDPTQGVRYTAVSFLTASVVFGSAHLLRGRGITRPASYRKRVRISMLGLNLATMVAFLSTYVSLTMIPAALSASIVAAVAPVVIIVVRSVLRRRPAARADVVIAGTLLVLSMTVGCWLSRSELGGDGAVLLVGCALAAVAGIGGAMVVLLSRRMATLAVDALAVSAGRFHCTYLAAALLLLATGRPLVSSIGELAWMAGLSLLSVALPLFLLQLAAQRADPLAVVVVGSSLPSLAYLIQVVSGERFDLTAFVLINGIVAVASIHSVRSARRPRRPEPVPT